MNISEHVKSLRTERKYPIAARTECADGFAVSIQASSSHYCQPRTDEGPWRTFELGYPSVRDDLIMPYIECSDEDPTQSVYAAVPADVVIAMIEKHGGLKR